MGTDHTATEREMYARALAAHQDVCELCRTGQSCKQATTMAERASATQSTRERLYVVTYSDESGNRATHTLATLADVADHIDGVLSTLSHRDALVDGVPWDVALRVFDANGRPQTSYGADAYRLGGITHNGALGSIVWTLHVVMYDGGRTVANYADAVRVIVRPHPTATGMLVYSVIRDSYPTPFVVLDRTTNLARAVAVARTFSVGRGGFESRAFLARRAEPTDSQRDTADRIRRTYGLGEA